MLISDLAVFHPHWHSKRNGLELELNDSISFNDKKKFFLWFFMRTFDRQLQKLRWKKSNGSFCRLNSRRSFINGLSNHSLLFSRLLIISFLLIRDRSRSIGCLRLLFRFPWEISAINVQKKLNELVVLHLFMASRDFYLNLSMKSECEIWGKVQEVNEKKYRKIFLAR